MPHRSKRRHTPIARARRGAIERLEDRVVLSAAGVAGAEIGATPEAEQPAPATFESMDALRAWIAQAATERYGDLFGSTRETPSWWGYWNHWEVDAIPALPVTDGAAFTNLALDASADLSGLSGSHSTTNTQVAGVDEADLIETDGESLFVVSDGRLSIVDVRDPSNLSVLAEVELDRPVDGIYLSSDRLTLVSGSRQPSHTGFGLITLTAWADHASPSPATTAVTVLDVSDPASPAIVESVEVDGRLVESRMVDGRLTLVTERVAAPWLPSPNYEFIPNASEDPSDSGADDLVRPIVGGLWRTNLWVPPQQGVYEYETLDTYVDRVAESLVAGWRVLGPGGEAIASGDLVAATDLETPTDPYPMSPHRTFVTTFDTTDASAGPGGTFVLDTADAAVVYATSEHLYLFGQSHRATQPPGFVTFNDAGWSTDVWKLAIDQQDGSIEQVATGEFAGRLLNQFSVDEHNGDLRVATDTGWGWRGSDQRVSVLRQSGDRLVEIGAVESLAPGEIVHSVRFVGDEAYAVTFRRVDPLFAIDLSDPANPTVEGELKIPGYSEYLQPIGEDHLLGIGRAADETTGLFEQMQVSIFDVGDLTDPTLVHRYDVAGGRGTASVATGDRWAIGDVEHHAITLLEDDGLLALPIETQPGSRWRWWGDAATDPVGDGVPFDLGSGGLLVLSIDVGAGFEELAVIEHDTKIVRSLRVGDALVAVSSGQVSAHSLKDPATALSRVELGGAVSTAGFAVLSTLSAEAGVPGPAAGAAAALGASTKDVPRIGPLVAGPIAAGTTLDAALLLVAEEGIAAASDDESAGFLGADEADEETARDAESKAAPAFGEEAFASL